VGGHVGRVGDLVGIGAAPQQLPRAVLELGPEAAVLVRRPAAILSYPCGPAKRWRIMTRKVLVLILAACTLGAVAATARAAAPTAEVTQPQAQVHVGFTLNRFVKQGKGLVALGAVTTTATAPDGTLQTATKPFRARVVAHGIRGLAAKAPCSVLDLELDKLALTLLGLNVNLDKVVLTIKADASGGALGSLFCQLAHTKVKLRTTSAYARKLTQAVRRNGLATSGNVLGFAVPLQQGSTAATGTCPILDLVLGPLHLDLLGLIVDLNQVHLTITADPTGGVLGSLFCSLSHASATLPLPTPTGP
jgi:hypothetical protein